MKAAAAGLTMALVLGVVGHAAARPVTLETTGKACDLHDLGSQVDRLVHDAAATTTAQVEVRERGSGFEAEVRFIDDDGTTRGPRIVRAATCDQLVQSIAIVVAMAARPREPGPREPSELDRPVDPPHREAAMPVVPHAVADDLALVAGPTTLSPAGNVAIVVAGAGGLSSTGASAQLLAGVRWRRNDYSLGAEVRADAPDSRQIGTGTGTVDIVRAQLSIRPCLHAASLALCGLVSAGAFHGSSSNIVTTGGAYSALLAAGLRSSFERTLTGRLTFRAHIDADALITTTVYEIDYMTAWRSPRVELSAGIGVLAQFP